MAEVDNINRFYYEHWIAHTSDQPPTGTNSWSMVLEEFHLGVCFNLKGTKDAWRRVLGEDRKTHLSDDGVFNCTKGPKSGWN
mmetsp:Transcript_18612/g.23098  ORF Transcript_18612/g.23098 Transcript_18612/m.23098 type:complete len:82 (+) Transcript_18612:21-266(+)